MSATATETPLPIPADVMSPRALQAESDPRDSVVIASIWPRPLRSEQPHYRRVIDPKTGEVRTYASTEYKIDAAGESMRDAAKTAQLLRVYDTYQISQVPGQDGRTQPLPIHCRAAAGGLVGMWSGKTNGALSRDSMGIMVIDGDEPTAAELAQMVEAQQNFFQDRYNAGQEAWRSGALRQIGDIERIAARWLNLHTVAEWVNVTESSAQMRECISCGGSLTPTATSCPNSGCGDLLAKADSGYWSEAALKETDPYLFERLREFRSRRADRERKAAQRATNKS